MTNRSPSPESSESAAPWTAERSVSSELALELLESQFPELANARVERLGEGWDNDAYLVNGAYVVRFPRRSVALSLLEAERRVLPALAPRLPLPIPVPTLCGAPSAGYPWPFLGYRLLPGRTACRAGLDDAARAREAKPLARFLTALHAIRPDEAADLGAAPDALGRLDVKLGARQTIERLERLREAGLPIDLRAHGEHAEAAESFVPSEERSLVHGDLYARHLLVDDAGALCGVIDWGDVHIGHPALDLAIAPGFLPPSAHEDFLRAYGHPISESTWALARFRALYSAVSIVAYGRSVGDRALLGEGLLALSYLAMA